MDKNLIVGVFYSILSIFNNATSSISSSIDSIFTCVAASQIFPELLLVYFNSLHYQQYYCCY